MQFAAIAPHELRARLSVALRVVEAHLHVLRQIDLRVALVIYLDVVIQIELQVESEYQLVAVGVVVAELLVVAGGEQEEECEKH